MSIFNDAKPFFNNRDHSSVFSENQLNKQRRVKIYVVMLRMATNIFSALMLFRYLIQLTFVTDLLCPILETIHPMPQVPSKESPSIG